MAMTNNDIKTEIELILKDFPLFKQLLNSVQDLNWKVFIAYRISQLNG